MPTDDQDHALAGLREVRKYRGVLVREAAAAIGVNESSYVRFENGSRRLYADKLFVLASLMRCSAEDLHIWRPENELAAVLGEPGRDGDPRLPQITEPAEPAPELPPPPPPPATDGEQVLEGWNV